MSPDPSEPVSPTLAPPGPEADGQLVRRHLDGDAVALDVLLARYRGPLLGFLIGRCSDLQVAEDLSQETLLRVLSQLPRLRDPAAFGGWLFRIASTVHTDWTRRQARQPRSLEPDRVVPQRTDQRTPSGAFAVSEQALEVARRVAQLSDNQRIAVLLRHQSGLRCREIAQAMGVPVGNVTKWLSRAYDRLRQGLGDGGSTGAVS